MDPGETKNEKARTIYLDDELMKEMKSVHTNRNIGCPYVFHRNGNRIKRITRAWKSASIKAGLCEPQRDETGKSILTTDKKGKKRTVMLPTKLFHDFRRTGIRNMVRAGVSERVAMMVSGHKTRSVFDRYNIVSDQDLREAARKMQAYHERLSQTSEPGENVKGEIIPLSKAQNK